MPFCFKSVVVVDGIFFSCLMKCHRIAQLFYLFIDSYCFFLLFFRFLLCFESKRIEFLDSFMEIIWDSRPKTNGPKRGLLLEMARALIGLVLFDNHHESPSSSKLFKSHKYWWNWWWRCLINNNIVVVFSTINHLHILFTVAWNNTFGRSTITIDADNRLNIIIDCFWTAASAQWRCCRWHRSQRSSISIQFFTSHL